MNQFMDFFYFTLYFALASRIFDEMSEERRQKLAKNSYIESSTKKTKVLFFYV